MNLPDVVQIRRALLSVFDKSGVVELAKALAARDVEILSTGGTARLLRENGIEIREVGEYTGHPEMLDGRVKTLHPKIHGGLLGRRDDEAHLQQMREHQIGAIDLVAVNLYPFESVAAKEDASREELVENIDIGGPSMLRSAAKNHAAVTVLCEPADYPKVIAELETSGGTSAKTRRALALKVFDRTARYDAAIAQTLASEDEAGDQEAAKVPPVLHVSGMRKAQLRYGENPHQSAGVYATGTDAIDLAGAIPLQGKALSYNNLLDADAAFFSLRCLVDGMPKEQRGCVVIKHGTPCGAARATTLLRAWEEGLSGDPVSAFGGIVALSHEVDEETALAMKPVFLEVVIAPGFSDGAREVFAGKKNLRLLTLPNLVDGALPARQIRSVSGGLLVQEHDRALTTLRICRAGRARGGQTSRVNATKIAIAKAKEHGHPLAGACLGSDAFFPFADGVLAAIEEGVTAIAQPGGSKRDDEVIAACDAHNVAMVMCGERHFRH